jgi:hypothetical protein
MTDPETFSEKYFVLDNIIPSSSSLTEEDYLLCRGHIGAFSFSDKKWGYFDVNFIEPIEFDRTIYTSSLMLGEKWKNMLLSLVRMQYAKSGQFFGDIIRGKAEGLVFLLHGEPGVGKTMTAGSSSPAKLRATS